MPVKSDNPFRIAILGDFSGRENRGARESDQLAARRPIRIDRDKFDDVMKRLGTSLTKVMVAADESPVSLNFECLDDFHPDHLYEKLALFSSLRELRDRLLDDSTFQDAAQEVLAWGRSEQQTEPNPGPVETDVPAVEENHPEDLLDQMLATSDESANSIPQELQWKKLIHDIAAPYSISQSDPRQAELLSCVDAAIKATMTALLHHRSFRELESAWRALHVLVHRLETDEQLQIYLIDLSKDELAEDLFTNDNLKLTGIYNLLVEQTVETPGGEPWSLVVGNYEFLPSDDDAALLGRMAKISAAAGACFLSAADSQLVDASSFIDGSKIADLPFTDNETWKALCLLPEAACISLAWPGFLLRLPYGANTNPIDQFEFEEMPDPPSGRHLLWGNPAFLCAALLGESFSRSGWDMDARELQPIDRLPVWVYDQDGESQIHPCGEFLLTDGSIENLRSSGITPLISIRDQDELRIGSVNSLRAQALLGPWSG